MALGPRGLRLLDDLLGDVAGDLLVVRELELEVPAATRLRAEVAPRLHVDDRVAGDDPLGQHLAHPLLDRRNEVPRDHAAADIVLELESRAAREGGQLEPAVAVLPVAAGLLLVLPLRLGRP